MPTTSVPPLVGAGVAPEPDALSPRVSGSKQTQEIPHDTIAALAKQLYTENIVNAVQASDEENWLRAEGLLRLLYNKQPVEMTRFVARVCSSPEDTLKAAEALQMCNSLETQMKGVEEVLKGIAMPNGIAVSKYSSRHPKPFRDIPFAYITREGESPAECEARRSVQLARYREQRAATIARLFRERRTVQFPFQKPHSKIASELGCGPAIISMLNVVDGFEVKKRYNTAGISEEQMLKELHDGGWETTELKDDILYTDENRTLDPIADDHIVLLSMRTTLNQNSWGVCWDGRIFHNSEDFPVEPLMCLNRIFNKKWLLWHPKLTNNLELLSLNTDPPGLLFDILPADYTREHEQAAREYIRFRDRLYGRHL